MTFTWVLMWNSWISWLSGYFSWPILFVEFENFFVYPATPGDDLGLQDQFGMSSWRTEEKEREREREW